MDIRSLQHCSLVVRDLERSRWFYGTVLGLEEVPRPSTFTFRGAWFRRQHAEVHLILAEDTTAPPGFPEAGSAKRTGLATHFAFEVADLEAAREELLRAGIPILGGPMPRGDGVMQLYIQDPDGYLIELFQRTPEGVGGPERGAVRE